MIIKHLKLASILVLLPILSNAQEYEWEFDKAKQKDSLLPIIRDSIMNRLSRRIEVSLGYGKFFLNTERQTQDSKVGATLPSKMSRFQISTIWHHWEHIAFTSSLDLQMFKNMRERPNIGNVINGGNLDIEGSGGALFSVLFGTRYYFLKNRFRPYVSLNGGVNVAMVRNVEVNGNISNGFSKNDISKTQSASMIAAGVGFSYRTGTRVLIGMGTVWERSSELKDDYTGFRRIEGLGAVVNVSFLLF